MVWHKLAWLEKNSQEQREKKVQVQDSWIVDCIQTRKKLIQNYDQIEQKALYPHDE